MRPRHASASACPGKSSADAIVPPLAIPSPSTRSNRSSDENVVARGRSGPPARRRPSGASSAPGRVPVSPGLISASYPASAGVALDAARCGRDATARYHVPRRSLAGRRRRRGARTVGPAFVRSADDDRPGHHHRPEHRRRPRSLRGHLRAPQPAGHETASAPRRWRVRAPRTDQRFRVCSAHAHLVNDPPPDRPLTVQELDLAPASRTPAGCRCSPVASALASVSGLPTARNGPSRGRTRAPRRPRPARCGGRTPSIRQRERAEAGEVAGFADGLQGWAGPPLVQADEVDRGRGERVLEGHLGQASVASTTHPAGGDRLVDGGLGPARMAYLLFQVSVVCSARARARAWCSCWGRRVSWRPPRAAVVH